MAPRPRPPAAFPDCLLLDRAGGPLRVRLRHSGRAIRYSLRLAAGAAEPVLTIPARGTLGGARAFLDRHQGWLDQRLRTRPALRPVAAGGIVLLRGVEHRVIHAPGRRGTCWIEPGPEMPAIAVTGELAHLARRVIDFLKREARRDLEAAVQRHAAVLGVRAASIALRDPKSRWGSCSSRRSLSFSWRLVMAPPFVLDYLAAHEVAHLREMNHGAGFWRLVDGLCPTREGAEAWLKRHGPALHAVLA